MVTGNIIRSERSQPSKVRIHGIHAVEGPGISSGPKKLPDMKKLITLTSLLPALASAQSLVHYTPEQRTALLEDFTGIHCGYCPEGHAIAADLEATYTDRIVVVGVHAGGYAVPQNSSEPDFRTDEGTAIDAFFTIGGYPAGVIDRHLFNGADDLGRGAWAGAVSQVLAMPSPVNVGVESSYDAGTQQLTVHVVGYYTGDSPSGSDYVSVLVKENHLIGWQTDYGNGNHTDYDHVHVLRHYLTDTWGENIGNHVAGDLVERTYTYTVPAEWNIANCEVVAFISEYRSEVYQAREVMADGGTSLVMGDLTAPAVPYVAGQVNTPSTFDHTLTNTMGAAMDYQIELTSADAPAGWNSSFTFMGNTYTNPATFTLNAGAASDIGVSIVPDATAGLATYELRITSVDDPGLPALVNQYHIISGVHDLVVTNPLAEPYEATYMTALSAEPAAAKTTVRNMIDFAHNGALSGVYNLYMNIGWTFPSLTDELVNELISFMDGGGNVMFAGQDIGWDQSGDAAAYGTPVTQAFYHDYMLSTFVSDGSGSQNQVDFEDGDEVFGAVATSGINTVYGATYVYPDHITPVAPAQAILRYNDNGIGGLRAQIGIRKLVYFCVAPEQMTDATVGAQMVQLSHDWFYTNVSVEELDGALAAAGRPFPSPASDMVNIPIPSAMSGGNLEVIDMAGRTVSNIPLTSTSLARVNVAGLNNGLYTARVRSISGMCKAMVFLVLH